MITAEDIAAALRARRTGKGSWLAKCPAHPDKSPSMSLTAAADGKILLCCHAGCPQEAVIQALRDLGLWDSKAPRDQVIPWEAPSPTPLPAPQSLYLIDNLVYEASQLDPMAITGNQVGAFLEVASQISYNAVMRVGGVISNLSPAGQIHAGRWMSQRMLEALHETRP